MIELPSLFYKFTSQLWYVLMSAVFFFFFVAVYQPFGMAQALDMGRGLFIFNVTMLMCIVLVLLLIFRLVFFLLKRNLCRNWIQYIAWTALEMTALTYSFALYLYLMSGHAFPYFTQLAICLQYTFLILVYPYFGITIVMFLVSQLQTPQVSRDSIRFTDANRQVKIVLVKDAILYIKADENYVRIHYLDNGKEKDYSLRSTMSAIAPLMDHFGFFRCHRSYYVNLAHIVALRRDPGDMISAELDVPHCIIPVSRRVYHALSERM